jgi:hypothetical protein
MLLSVLRRLFYIVLRKAVPALPAFLHFKRIRLVKHRVDSGGGVLLPERSLGSGGPDSGCQLGEAADGQLG